MKNEVLNNVEDYIQSFEPSVQKILQDIRTIIQTIAPLASESISYGIPAYKYKKKPLIYFASFKNHIGLYATPTAQEHFKKELFSYKQGKGSVQFPLDQPIPYDLISAITSYNREAIDKKF